MRVEAILKDKGDHVETIRPDASVVGAVHKLATLRIGALVVSPDANEVTGLLTERDIVVGLARHGTELLDMPVRQVMSTSVRTCTPDERITGVMAVMTRTRSRHLPVVDESGLRGIVSIGDVVKSRLDELELESRVLRDAYITSH